MKTIRLFDRDVDLLEFAARVVSCEEKDGKWAAVLDQTAFFPEGGGQMPDLGTLDGTAVLDVQEKQGVICHLLEKQLEVGSTVHGSVDPDRRLDMMQQHSGEHVLTGLIHQTFGYDNVGFRIGAEDVTLDFNGTLTGEQLEDMERRANEVIARNIPVIARFPSPEELATMSYRSKKKLEGDIRIVTIPGVDVCACCGTHVRFTGAIGQIKVMACQSWKGGVRVTIRCGLRALKAADRLLQDGRAVSRLLSCPLGELAAGVERLCRERDSLKEQGLALQLDSFRQKAAAESGPVRLVEMESMESGLMRKGISLLTADAVCGLLLVRRGEGWSFLLSAEKADVRPLGKGLIATFGGKGGGPRDGAQGVLNGGTAEEIRNCLQRLCEEMPEGNQ